MQGSRRGDLYIKLLVQVPQRLSKREKELLEEFRATEAASGDPRPVKLSELKS